MLSIIFGASTYLLTGFFIPSIIPHYEQSESDKMFFFHISVLYLTGAYLLLKFLLDKHFKKEPQKVTAEEHRRFYCLGCAGLMACTLVEEILIEWLSYLEGTYYLLYLISHISLFILLRFALFPGSSFYWIRYKHRGEYAVFCLLFTLIGWDVIKHLEVDQKLWMVHSFYHCCMSIYIVDIHAILTSKFEEKEQGEPHRL